MKTSVNIYAQPSPQLYPNRIPQGLRLTEEGELRVTEEGELRVSEEAEE